MAVPVSYTSSIDTVLTPISQAVHQNTMVSKEQDSQTCASRKHALPQSQSEPRVCCAGQLDLVSEASEAFAQLSTDQEPQADALRKRHQNFALRTHSDFSLQLLCRPARPRQCSFRGVCTAQQGPRATGRCTQEASSTLHPNNSQIRRLPLLCRPAGPCN